MDYGGGHGILGDHLRDAGWDSTSYDPFVDRNVAFDRLGRFDLIAAFVPNLAFAHGMSFASSSDNFHALWRTRP
jgi:hypothetical protein